MEVVRFADPFSWQSWCLEPVVCRLEEVFGDALRIVYRMGGLFEGFNEWMTANGLTNELAVSTIGEVRRASGMPLLPDYFWRSSVKTTYVGCLAYKAAELQDPQLARRYFRRLMEAFMVEGRPASHDEYMRLGAEVGVNTSRLRRDIEIPLVTDLFDSDRREMSSVADATFDSLLIYTPTAHTRVQGYASKPYEDAIRTLAPEVSMARPSDLAEYAERRGTLIAAREIGEVFQVPDGVATDRLAALASAGILETVPSEAGQFWRWKGPGPDRLPLLVALASYIPTVVPSDIDLARIVGAAVRARYANIAARPSHPQPFPIGKDAALRFGYPKDLLGDVPAAAVESFSGVGNVFAGAEIDRSESILDQGCGSGTDSFLASAWLSRKGTVHGFDFTPSMVAKAMTCVAEQGAKRIQIQEGNTTSLPLAAESVDVAISNGVLHLVKEKAGALRELLRVLRPGGRLKLASVVLRTSLPTPLGSDSDLWADGLAGAPLDTALVRALETVGFREPRVVSEHEYFAGSAFPAVRRIALAVGARSIVVDAVKPERSKKRR